MNRENFTTLLFLLGALALCWLLHWLIGLAERRFKRASDAVPAEQPAPIKHLILSWSATGLRTFVWLVYCVLLVNLLPQTRDRVDGFGSKLWRVRDQLLSWLTHRGVNLILIAAITIFLARFAAALIQSIFQLIERSAVERGEVTTRRRLQTLASTFSRVAQTVIYFIGLMTFLRQLNVDVTPILASAGVVGLAVGFGAQSLIRDLFGGFLILIEEQFNVGDTVKIGETSGTVEHLTLRSTRVRGLDGALTTIPNGSISTVSNLSRGWTRVMLDVEVDYAEDLDRAMQVALEAARTLQAERPSDVVEEPAMWGIDRVVNAVATIRLAVKTRPSQQPEIGRELRRRIKQAFDREHIKTPSSQPQIVLRDRVTAMPEQKPEQKNPKTEG